MTSAWIDELKVWPVAEVAQRFGFELVRRGSDISFACPACGKDQRHSRGSDPRKAVKIMPDNRWWCEPCGAGGDVASLAAAKVTKTPHPPRAQWSEVRAACQSVGLLSGAFHRHLFVARPPSPPLPVRVDRPPHDEVVTFWNSCRPISQNSDVGHYLRRRGLTGPALQSDDPTPWTNVARETPDTLTRSLNWWPHSWLRHWPIIFPAYDPTGRLVSIHGRAIDRTTDPKTRWPKGFSASGLLFADSMGACFLRRRAEQQSTEGLEAVVIVEGATDTLKMARVLEGTDATVAVLGYVAGSKHALKQIDWPYLLPCLVATDNDVVGDRYSSEVRPALDPRVQIYRVRPPGRRTRAGSKITDWSDCTDAEVREALEAGLNWEACND